MKVQWVFLFSILALSFQSQASLIVGLDRETEIVQQLTGKTFALVVNQASVNSQGVHGIDVLLALGLRPQRIFALEHGVRGQSEAGEEVPDSVDPSTGIPIVSLYGPQKKPTPAMLADVDVVVYDIQDVGVRFYTYISSLGLIMQAAQENKNSVLILDRPNPNGDYVAGPVLQMKLRSFVGAYPIPIVYGLTVGELSQLILGENWLNTKGLNLKVLEMKNYDPKIPIAPFRSPSPRLKSLAAIRMYPSLALMEPTVMNLGEGTANPFLQIGFPRSIMGAHHYTPVKQHKNEKPKYEGQKCYGEKYFELRPEALPTLTTDIFVLMQSRFGRTGFVTDRRFLELLVGHQTVVDKMINGEKYFRIQSLFRKDLQAYIQLKKKYQIYR